MNCPDCKHPISKHSDEGCWHEKPSGDLCECDLTQGEVALAILEAEGWISVKDGLPENRIGKIVCCKDKSVTMMYYDPEKRYWVSQMGFDRYDVTHWMDKPTPPDDKEVGQ